MWKCNEILVFDSAVPVNACMHNWIWSPFVHEISCGLFGANPLPKMFIAVLTLLNKRYMENIKQSAVQSCGVFPEFQYFVTKTTCLETKLIGEIENTEHVSDNSEPCIFRLGSVLKISQISMVPGVKNIIIQGCRILKWLKDWQNCGRSDITQHMRQYAMVSRGGLGDKYTRGTSNWQAETAQCKYNPEVNGNAKYISSRRHMINVHFAVAVHYCVMWCLLPSHGFQMAPCHGYCFSLLIWIKTKPSMDK